MKQRIYRGLRVWNDVDAVRRGRIIPRLWNKLIGRQLWRIFR